MMAEWSRRRFLGRAAQGAALAALPNLTAWGQQPGERPRQDSTVEVLNPRGRVPLALIIDDSTCLVNLNKFAVPQFEYVWDYQRPPVDWRSWPDEIPDDFVRKFVDWCGEHGVKGKYSVVPYPACVGRIDRILPGWGWEQLDASLKLVRDHVTRDWDIHPEMVSHTWVIDTRTGHPYPERTQNYMENWGWSAGRSVDELADYMAYALRILHNVELPCEGITTPGGFGTRALPELSQATLEACRDVYRTEIPHYFRHLYAEGQESVAPRVEYAAGLGTDDPRCAVSIIGCTGDWTGGWDCQSPGEVDRFITADLERGRMVDVIERGEPGAMVCHWTGIYYNGQEVGFKVFQEVVRRLHERYDNLTWMKLSEMARYWAAKELTAIERQGGAVKLDAPFACPGFTVAMQGAGGPVRLGEQPLEEVAKKLDLRPGTWTAEGGGATVCFDLRRGRSGLRLA